MLTAVGRASLRRVVAPSTVSRASPLLVKRFILSAVERTPSAAAQRQCRAFTNSRCLSLPAAAAKKKKPATKKKAAAKKTKAKKKPAKKVKAKKPKKPLTPEEKDRLDLRNLRAKALLTEPTKLPDSKWLVHVVEGLKGKKLETTLAGRSKALSESFKALSESELQALQAKADHNKDANRVAYKAWVASHTPAQIWAANMARGRLARKYKVAVRKITDDRLPKKPLSAYSLFVKARWASGNVDAKVATDAAKEMANEWKALPENEKRAYVQMSDTQKTEYAASKKSIGAATRV